MNLKALEYDLKVLEGYIITRKKIIKEQETVIKKMEYNRIMLKEKIRKIKTGQETLF